MNKLPRRVVITGSGVVSALGYSVQELFANLLAGATAVEVGAANLVNPYICRDIIRDLPRVMKKYRINDLNEIIGGIKNG